MEWVGLQINAVHMRRAYVTDQTTIDVDVTFL